MTAGDPQETPERKSVLVVAISDASFVWRCQLCPMESRRSWGSGVSAALDAGFHVRAHHPYPQETPPQPARCPQCCSPRKAMPYRTGLLGDGEYCHNAWHDYSPEELAGDGPSTPAPDAADTTPGGWPLRPTLADGHVVLDDPFYHPDAILERLRRNKQREREATTPAPDPHADALREFYDLMATVDAERDALRARLAEAERLLRMARGWMDFDDPKVVDIFARVDAFLAVHPEGGSIG